MPHIEMYNDQQPMDDVADMTSGYSRGEAPGTHWAYNDLAINLYRHLAFLATLYASLSLSFLSCGFVELPQLDAG